jgi:hypothetical protein
MKCNGIMWTAQIEVPASGVRTAPPDLAAFEPVSIEPRAPKKATDPKQP